MTTRPAAAYYSDNARDEGEGKQFIEDLLAIIKELPGGDAENTKTLDAGGSITPTVGITSVDTLAAAAADDLDFIATTNYPSGSILLIRGADDAHVVRVRHNQVGAGKILLKDGQHYYLSTKKWLALKQTAGDWEEIPIRGDGYLFEVLDKTANYTVLAADREKRLTQRGAGAEVRFALTGLPVGFRATFLVVAAQNLRIDADGGETIQLAGATSGAGGRLESSVPGDVCVIEKIAATEWWVTATSPGDAWAVT